MEPTIRIERVKDTQAHGVYVEQDESNPYHFVVSASKRVEWLTALEAVTSYLEVRERTGRDD